MAVRIDFDDLRKLAPKGKADILRALVEPMNEHFPRYGITKPLRVAHFMAQAAHEADGFKTLQEYASGSAYEGRKDLGNTHPGDGRRFKGRGIFQLTGRANYIAYGAKLGLDLVGRPETAAEPEVSVRVACEYWKAKGLNTLADKDDIDRITKRINGGYNGLADRKRYLAIAKRLFAVEDEPTQQPDDPGVAPEDEPRKKTGVTEIGTAGGLGTAVDAVTTATDTIRTVNDAKESVTELGVMDYVVALFSNPRFLISAFFLVAIIGGVVWWQFKKRRQ